MSSSRTLGRRRVCWGAATAMLFAAGAVAVASPANAQAVHQPTSRVTRTVAGRGKKPDPVGETANAIDQARKTGRTVQIETMTDQSSVTSANPDGTLTRTVSSSPRRVRQNGAWVPIDTTLIRQKDGGFVPKATTTALSIGGAGNRITLLTDGRNKLDFRWPTILPEPSVAGDTAVYANVLPGVDLHVTANPSGFSSIFVVKTAKAAANPALRKLGLVVEATNLNLKATSNSGAQASDAITGAPVFHTDTALMWDSSAGPDSPSAVAGLAANPTRAGPGRLGGHVAKVAVAVRSGRQWLSLDQKMLAAKTTKYPVFIDPIWSGSPSKSQLNWARISSNGWNIYNSTSTSGSSSARIGFDDWPGGGGEQARTYYQMNTSGIKGAVVLGADLYVVEHWAAGCSSTDAVLYATGNVSGWNSSGLSWGHEPSRGALLSTKGGGRVDCGMPSERTSPASLDFTVTGQIKTVVSQKLNSTTFMVQAKDMNDRYSWKQLGFGGGATLSVRYSFPPKLLDGDGDPAVKPSIADTGRTVTTTHTPTLSARATNPDLAGGYEKVMVDYHVFNAAGTLVTYGYGPRSGFSRYGSDWTTPSLPDGTYTWKVTAENENKIWMTGWGAAHTFTIDTVAPHAPSVSSTQFPPKQVGAAFDSKGTFALGNDRTNNVTGYLFSLDGNLANTVYSTVKGTAWTATTVLKPGTIYFAKADNADGTGTAVVNGSAGVSFAPGTVGAHTLYAKAVDQAGSTSPQTSYVLNAGTSSPIYAYGDKMVSGYTATNTDGSTTVVPAAVKTSAGGVLVSQSTPKGVYFADGFQAILGNNATTGTKVTSGDSMKLSFDVPSTGAWDLGLNLTTASDYGAYNVTLDAGTANALMLTPQPFDARSAVVLTHYIDFGLLKRADGSLAVLGQGVHTLTVAITGKNTSSNGYQAGVDVIRLAPTLSCSTLNLAGCLNNVVTSSYTGGATPKVTPADGDGGGASIEAADLADAGWTGGRTVTVNGATIKLPPTFGTGAKDNMLASGQFVVVPGSGAVNKGNAVVFVGFATGTAAIKHASGTITYTAGTGCDVATQPYTIDTVRDWGSKDRGALVTFPHRNKSDATQSSATTSLFTFSVPLSCPGATVTTISLPLVTNSVLAGAASLHFMGVGIRPLAATNTNAWTSSWTMANDTGFVQSQPTDTNTATVNATLSAQTIRIPAYLSIGGTGQVRVHLANTSGKVPVRFDAASIAVQDQVKGGANAESAPMPLTFGGVRDVSLAPGTELASDPVALAVASQRTALVSLKVHGTVNAVSGHLDARTPSYITTADDADHTTDVTSASFSTSTLTGLPYLAAVDVSTPAAAPTGSVVLYGDQTVNADTATGNGRSQLSALLADSLAREDSTGHSVPFGLLNQGSSSWNNRVLLPEVGDEVVANSANGTVDQQILAQAGMHSVLVSAGSTDLLACLDTADACAKLVEDKLVALVTQVHQYKTDDGARIEVNVATLPAFNGSHTATQESARQLVNAYIITAGSPLALQGYADGLVDFASAVSIDGTSNSSTLKAADYTVSNGRNLPNDLYYLDLSRQYINDANTGDQDDSSAPGTLPVAVWALGEGTGAAAADTGNGTGVGSDRTLHPATLHNTTWSAGRTTDSRAATFNGNTSYADSALQLDTTQSFTVSLWARLTDNASDHTVFAREARGAFASFSLRYQASTDRWLAEMPSTTSGTPVLYDTLSSSTAKTGVWTHLAAVYDAQETSLTIYVDGQGDSSVDGVQPFVDSTGTTLIGHSDQWTFAGDLADVWVWARATDQAEMADAAHAEPVGIWRFDEGVGLTAGDSSDHAHDATITGGAHWVSGHRDWDIGSLGFNGTDSAASATSVLNTDQSFSVTAWANLSSTATSATVAAQDGSRTSAFQLGFDKDCGCWAFSLPAADADGARRVTAAAPAAAVIGTWTHLAGVYDAVDGTATLYVNGDPVTTVAVPATPWKTAGSLTVGRGRMNGAAANWFAGSVDDLRVYQGIETDTEVSDDYQS